MSESDQRLEAIKRGIVNAIATVMAGRGRLQAARTVKDHVRAAISLIELEQRAVYILRMGNYAAGVLQSTTPQPAPHSNEPMNEAESQILADMREGFKHTGTMPTAMERGGEL